MIEDVYNPVASYRDDFCGKFAEAAAMAFADLQEKSGVDAKANAETVREVNALSEKLGNELRARRLFSTLIGVSWTLFAIAAAAIFYLCWTGSWSSDYPMLFIGLVVLDAAVLILAPSVLHPAYRRHKEESDLLQVKVDKKTQEAWAQMAPLNALYDWDITSKLIESVVPRIKFDPYFSEERLQELRDSFGLDDTFDPTRSVLFAQSGEINGNPFAIGHILQMEVGLKRYYGERTVTYTDWVRDSKGNTIPVTRFQTLVAHVDKPIPEYSEGKVLVYGNDAAPRLCFDREPNGLAGASNGMFGMMRLKGKIRELEKFSRNLDDDSNYTIMGNREFEALFETRNRNDETEYRLLFTPLAQRQMLEIIKDKSVGFGDDFSFTKSYKINTIQAEHLDKSTIDTDPRRFHDYDLNRARRTFVEFNIKYFHNVYFALAPLLAIPLYQQIRSHKSIWGDLANLSASTWECESLANFHGEDKFRHEMSVTRNILKTSGIIDGIGNRRVSVTAYGYRTEDRVDNVDVLGPKGRIYSVPVKWQEYLPVEKTTPMNVSERLDLSGVQFASESTEPAGTIYRRNILSSL